MQPAASLGTLLGLSTQRICIPSYTVFNTSQIGRVPMSGPRRTQSRDLRTQLFLQAWGCGCRHTTASAAPRTRATRRCCRVGPLPALQPQVVVWCAALRGIQQQRSRLCDMTACAVDLLCGRFPAIMHTQGRMLRLGSRRPHGCQLSAAQCAFWTTLVPTCLCNLSDPKSQLRAGNERWRVGAVVPLQPTDDSPFLGNLKTAAPQLAAEIGSNITTRWLMIPANRFLRGTLLDTHAHQAL